MKLRRKNSVIEAVQYTGDNTQEIVDFLIKKYLKIKKSGSTVNVKICINVDINETEWLLDELKEDLVVALDSAVYSDYEEVK